MAVPSRGDDAVGMLRGCLAMAEACGRVVTFIEPIALHDLVQLVDGQVDAMIGDAALWKVIGANTF